MRWWAMFCYAKHRPQSFMSCLRVRVDSEIEVELPLTPEMEFFVLRALMLLYYFLAAVSFWFGLLSLRGGFRFVSYVRQQTSLPLANFHPFVSVIAPSRGLETGLVENIRPLLEQDYPNYEVLLVFDSSEDPALAAVEKLLTERGSAKIVIAGPATDTGQKVHNLQFAVGQIAPQSEVLAFVDTDARPNRRWLKQLVAPLHD